MIQVRIDRPVEKENATPFRTHLGDNVGGVMDKISRSEALSKGLKRYFTGKPCKHGHIAERKVSNKECYQCSLERNRDWHQRNKEKARTKKRKLYPKHRDKIIERALAYQKTNPEVSRATQAKRRKNLLDDSNSHTAADIKRLLLLQKRKCAYCLRTVGDKVKYHVDHIVPLAMDGDNSKDNIQILCAMCNQKKSASDPFEYAARNGRLL